MKNDRSVPGALMLCIILSFLSVACQAGILSRRGEHGYVPWLCGCHARVDNLSGSI
jgi:hypothetical protein